MDVLKSFSNNLNIWIISKLTLLSFLLGLGQIFLVFSMPSNTGLYPGHFEYYVVNHWVILNPLEKLVFFSLCFSVSNRQSVWLVSAHKLCLTFCDWWFQCQLVLKTLLFYLGLPCSHTPQGSVWGPCGSLYCSSVLKAPLGLLHTCVAWG